MKKRALSLHINVELLEMDAQYLAFPDDHFDTVFATFVFCSVPDPVLVPIYSNQIMFAKDFSYSHSGQNDTFL